MRGVGCGGLCFVGFLVFCVFSQEKLCAILSRGDKIGWSSHIYADLYARLHMAQLFGVLVALASQAMKTRDQCLSFHR